MATIVEICVGDVPSALVAESAGADRVELCADLGQGGTTPSIGAIGVALNLLRRVALRVMIRPRGGDFRVSEVEERVMLADLEAIQTLPNPNGLSVGFVLGAGWAGGLDLPMLRHFVGTASPMPVTVHKVFDELADQPAALEDLIDIGASAVLTSGAAPTALEGSDRLRELRRVAGERLQIVAGGGIRAHNVEQVLERTGVPAVHLRAPAWRDGREAIDAGEVGRVVEAVRSFDARERPPSADRG